MEKTKILLLTHGGWGSALVEAVQMILGKVTFCDEIALTPEVTFDEYEVKVSEAVENLDSNGIIITDFMGGSTTNVANKVGYKHNVKVLTGLSAPLLIEACSQLMFNKELDIDSLLEKGNDICKDSIDEVIKKMRG